MSSKLRLFTSLLIIFFLPVNIYGQEIKQAIEKNETAIWQYQEKIQSLKSETDSLKLTRDIVEIESFALPEITNKDALVKHSALILQYNEEHEQADWVAHKISVDILTGAQGRTNDFRADPKVSTGTAEKDDYWYSGFDRGHLAPSADFRWSQKAVSESYYYSNMSPQRPEFNREAWADLENTLRRYVEEKQRPLYVVTGPYYSEKPKKLGDNKVSIPQYYFKTALDYTADTIAGVAFLMPNAQCEYPVFSYALTIDSLESITGINFYHQLPDSAENIAESIYDYDYWKFAAGSNSILPIHRNKLPPNTINTVQARSYYDKQATVCGTVASAHTSDKGHLFLNFDGQFPDQLFWCTVWKNDLKNFSYDPEKLLADKKICVSGVVKQKYGKPSMSLSNEKQIQMYKDLLEE